MIGQNVLSILGDILYCKINSQLKNTKSICISLKRQPHADAFNNILFVIFDNFFWLEFFFPTTLVFHNIIKYQLMFDPLPTSILNIFLLFCAWLSGLILCLVFGTIYAFTVQILVFWVSVDKICTFFNSRACLPGALLSSHKKITVYSKQKN